MHNLIKTIQTLHRMNPEVIKFMLAIRDFTQEAEQHQAEQQLRVLDNLKCAFSHIPRKETEERLVPLVTDKEEFVSDVNKIICAFSDCARNHCVMKNKQQQRQEQERLRTNSKNKTFPNSKISEPIVTVQDHQDMLISENDSKNRMKNEKMRKRLRIPSVSMSSNDSTSKRMRRDATSTTTSSSNRSSSLSSNRKQEEDEDQGKLQEQGVTLILSNKNKESISDISSSSNSSSSSISNLQVESARHHQAFKKRLLTMRYNQEREEDTNLLLSLSFVPS